MNQPSTFLLPPNVRPAELTCESLGDECTDAEARDGDGFTSDRLPDSLAASARQTFGKFLVLRTLGRGGQATALLAFDPDLRRQVVLKVYHAARTEAQRTAVLQEGQALAQVDSPFVAKCYGAERREGVPYLIIEYVAGETLAEMNQKRRLTVAESIDLLEKVARGVEAIHAQGLLHRDLKPSNILIAADGTPRLVDFGLAAAIGSEKLRQISGTPAYMAPEQAAGDLERMDQRTDIFGLGAVFYELLTGRPPYLGESVASVWSQAKVGDVLPAIDRARELKPSVSDVCMRCLAKEPTGRFESTQSFREALEDLRLGRRRHWNFSLGLGKYRVRLAFGVSVALVLITLGLGWRGDRGPRELALGTVVSETVAETWSDQPPAGVNGPASAGPVNVMAMATAVDAAPSPPTGAMSSMAFDPGMAQEPMSKRQVEHLKANASSDADSMAATFYYERATSDKSSPEQRLGARRWAYPGRSVGVTIWESLTDGWFAIWASDGQGQVTRLWPVGDFAQQWLNAGDQFAVEAGPQEAGPQEGGREEIVALRKNLKSQRDGQQVRLYLLTAQDELAIDGYLPNDGNGNRELGERPEVAEATWRRVLEIWGAAPGRKVQVVENDGRVGNLTP